ncbi:GNVR domain-containing protein [Chlorobium sp.]|uniref:GumC family protein n=1 Tax=Chlorobium sp. TaxID=1095 RepID=UPI0025C24A30|nr:GNVR domain-containing protein [Chlorobium sp.]
MKAEHIRNTNLIEVSASSSYPEEAALLANTACEAYRLKDGEWNAAQDLSVSRTIEEQIEQQQKKVSDIENAMTDFMKNRQVYDASGNVGDLQGSYTDAEAQYNANRVQYDILRKQLAYIDQRLSDEERVFSRNVSQNITVQLRSMRENIRTQENAYIALALEKGMQDEGVKAAFSQLNYAKAQYDQITRKKIAGELANSSDAQKYRFDLVASKMQMNVKLAELDNSAGEYLKLKNYYQAKLNQLPDKQITYAKLQLDLQVANKTYAFLKEKLDEARIKVASNAGRVIILKPALVPEGTEYPNFFQNLLIGLGAGLALGIAIVLGKDMMK